MTRGYSSVWLDPRACDPPDPIPAVTTIDDVAAALDAVLVWAARTPSRLGYFAALYKRITLAVGLAIDAGEFEDRARMERLDVAFAGRYLDALNGYFHPDRYPKPTRSWRTTFDHAADSDPILLQHMLSGIDTHILLDLGSAAVDVVGRTGLTDLEHDFGTINAVLASQVSGVVTDINELSPALAEIYAVLAQNQIFAINEVVRMLRDSAWRFARVLSLTPSCARSPVILARDVQIAGQCDLIVDPPGMVGVLTVAINQIAARESRDVRHNIEVLDEVAAIPAPIATSL